MGQLRTYRKKIKSAKNIAKLTKAMQMVAASKMRRAQDMAISGKDYANGLSELTKLLTNYLDPKVFPLMSSHEAGGKELVVVIAPEKGLCGSLTTNIQKKIYRLYSGDFSKVEFLVVGKKAKKIVSNFGAKIVAEFSVGVSKPSYEIVPTIAKIIQDKFLSLEIDKVYVVYSEFINTMKQEPLRHAILPLKIVELTDVISEGHGESEFIFEPSAHDITAGLLGRYLEVVLYHLILESYASEQSARMVAMKNATDNARGLISDLTLSFNKERQSAITSGILDVSSRSN